MKTLFQKFALCVCKSVSALALLAALCSAVSMCWFMTYQPDVPKELLTKYH